MEEGRRDGGRGGDEIYDAHRSKMPRSMIQKMHELCEKTIDL